MIKQVIPTSEAAYTYYGEAALLLKKAINKGVHNEMHSIGDGKANICIIVKTDIARAIIIASNARLFATHPKPIHISDYPFNPLKRGLIEEDLTYTPPVEDDTETKVEAGNCYWHGLEATLSWRGSIGFNLATDYYEADPIDITYIDPQKNEGASGYFLYTNYGPCVHENEEIIWGTEGDEGDTVPLVMGACYFEGQLVVIGRIFNGTRFVLNAYNSAGEILATIEVGRYNSIWNFKKDGSAGISSDAGKVYRCSIGLDGDNNLLVIFAPEENIERVPIMLSSTEVNTTRTVPDGPIPSTPYALVPARYASLSYEEKADFDALANYERTQTITKSITANGSGSHIIYYSYNESDAEVQLEYDIEIDISHYYQTKVYTKNDLMLLVPEGSKGLVKTDPCLTFSDNVAGALVTYTGCDLNPTISGISLTPYGDTSTLFTLDTPICDGTSYTIQNCTGGIATCIASVTTTPLTITASSSPLLINGTVSAQGGIPPYSYSADAGTWEQVGDSYKLTACSSGTGAFATVVVTDFCGNETSAAIVFSGSWVQISDTGVGPLECGTNQCLQGSWTISYVISGDTRVATVASLPNPTVTGSVTATYTYKVYWQCIAFTLTACNSRTNCYDNGYVAGQTLVNTAQSAMPDPWNYTNCEVRSTYYWYIGGRDRERTINYEWRCA